MRILRVILIIMAISVSVTYALYIYKSPIFVPYVDFDQVRASGFYLLSNTSNKKLDYKKYVEENTWFETFLHEISASKIGTQEYKYNNLLDEMKDKTVRFVVTNKVDKSIIIGGELKGKDRCLILRLSGDETSRFELNITGNSAVHKVGGVIANLCNKGDFSPSYVSYFDYLYFDLFKCFGKCGISNEIVFMKREDDEEEIIDLIQGELSKQELKYHAISRSSESIQIEITKIIASKKESYVYFKYINPIVGEVNSFAKFDNTGATMLINIGKRDHLLSYFE